MKFLLNAIHCPLCCNVKLHIRTIIRTLLNFYPCLILAGVKAGEDPRILERSLLKDF